MWLNRLFYLIIILMTGIIMSAQNTLWLTNGKKIEIGEFKIQNKDYISDKTPNNKFKSIESYDVFSIVESNGNEIIIYKQDSSSLEAFNLIEMRAFLQGETDAMKDFKSPLITTGGFVVAGASALFIPPTLVILTSGAYCAGVGLIKPNEKKFKIPLEYKNNEHYLLGYKKEVKNKRIKNAIIGTGIGLIAGFTTLAIISKNN